MTYRKLTAAAAVIALAACATGNVSPSRSYDFGIAPAATGASLPVHLEDVRAPEWLNRNDMLYRLAYKDPRALEPYAHSRWAGPPAGMLALRLKQALGETSPQGARCALRIELQEFSQVFETATTSRAILTASATVRSLTDDARRDTTILRIEKPAPTPDAAGGAAAFAAISDTFTQDINTWITSLGYCAEPR